MKKRKILGAGLMVGGLLLLLLSAGLLGYNLWENQQAETYSQAVLTQLPQSVQTDSEEGEEAESAPAEEPLFVTDPEMEMPTVEVDGNQYIGRLDIPALGLSLPVLSQWSYPNLKLAPCRYAGSAYQNNLIIAAHNYESHFGNLKNLSSGDQVLFTDVDGNVFTYEVAEIEQLFPTDVAEMSDGGWALTLFTCTIGGSYRVTVRCELAS